MRWLVRLVMLVLAVSGCGGSPDSSGEVVAEATAASLSSTTLEPTTTAPATTTAATTTTSAAPTTTVAPTTITTLVVATTTTLAPVDQIDSGLYCRDLHAIGYSYAEAVTYWVREGSPDRMDADRNGIPCETVWPASDVVDFWGEPLPTTTPTQRYEVGAPTYYPESLPGAGDYFGSGCSPGTTNLPDGVWFGRIEAASSTAVEFDLICFAPTPPGEDGVGRMTNSNPRLRTVPVASGAAVYAIAPDGGWMLMPYPDWRIVLPGAGMFCPPEGCWDVWLYVNGGQVTEIVQLWFP